MAKHFARCWGNNRSGDFRFWNDFRHGAADYVLLSEPTLSGEGQYPAMQMSNYRVYRVLKQIETLLGGETARTRKLSLALLDEYQCDWTYDNFQQNVLEVNQKLNLMPASVIAEAFKGVS